MYLIIYFKFGKFYVSKCKVNIYFGGSIHSTFTMTYFEIKLYDYMHKTSLQISLHDTSMVCGPSFEAFVKVFLIYSLST